MTAFGLGVTLSGTQSADARLESVLADLAKRLMRRRAGVMINIDEMQNADTDEVRAIGNVLQLVANRREYPIVFVCAGLPSLKRDLLTGEQATFLQRYARHHIGRIDAADVRRALAKPLEHGDVPIDDDALEVMVDSTEGYPYMVQLVGMCVWNAAEDPQRGLTLRHAEIGVDAARFSALAEHEHNEDEEILYKRLQGMIDAGLVEDIAAGDRYGLAFPASREWIRSRLDSSSDSEAAPPWRVPSPATPAGNATHLLSERTLIAGTLREHPLASYRSVARGHEVSAVYAHRVAAEEGLTRFCWQDLLIHLRNRSDTRSPR